MNVELYPKTAPGDNLMRSGSALGDSLTGARSQGQTKAGFVRSSMVEPSPSYYHYDALDIEARARAARSAWIGGKLKSWYAALARKLGRGGHAASKVLPVGTKTVPGA